jgi:hypothetical protein
MVAQITLHTDNSQRPFSQDTAATLTLRWRMWLSQPKEPP